MALLSVLILVGSGISLGIGFSSRGAEPAKVAGETADDRGAETSTDLDQILEGKINLNTASVDQLDLLPGIGPAYAQRIIDYRDANGPFKAASEIQNIAGIGPKTFEKIKDLITVE